MKKSINFISSILLALAFNACSANMDDSDVFDLDESLAEWGITYQNVCPSVTDAVIRPEPWNVDVVRTFVISDETIRSMSTCGLLVTYLNFPVVLAEIGSDLFASSVTMFNNKLRENKVALEFFERNDFYSALVSKYLSLIKITEYHEGIRVSTLDGPYNIEWLLANDMIMSAMSQKEKTQVMVMALERTKYAQDFENIQPCLIMIAIMKTCKYGPFLKDIEPRLVETSAGYTMPDPDGELSGNSLNSQNRAIIIKYAKQFLNEQK